MARMDCDLLIEHCRLVACTDAALRPVEDGAIAVAGERIVWAGPHPQRPPSLRPQTTLDATGLLATPGLIDCHTHLVYAGDRAPEFEQRLAGASYAQIAQAGGGIVSTVAATRAADAESLAASATARLRRLMAEGVTALEIKSGYGLSLEAEAKCLRVARRLGRERIDEGLPGEMPPPTVRTTFLGAHAVPPEFAGRPDDYVGSVCAMLPLLHAQGLVDAVDAFCDRIGFTPAQTRRVFDTAQACGLPVKLHAEQLSDQGGAQLAAGYGALSCDHLEYASEAGVAALARTGTVAVLLPGAFYFLRETRLPPVALLRRYGVPMAVATDCNPGSSPTTSLLLMLNMACTLFGLTPAEAFLGVTRHAARALGLARSHGTLEAGKTADICLWEARDVAALCYPIGAAPPSQVIRRGSLPAA
jgi:imidazolonepropionase